jgi:hypothetical protein
VGLALISAISNRFKIKICEISKCAVDDAVYGIPIDSLSTMQKTRVMNFASDVEPWLLSNIGDFGVDWFVEIDKQADSLRLTFKDQETETYFTLAWMHGAKLQDGDNVQA